MSTQTVPAKPFERGPRSLDEIHQAENFFGRMASFILAGPYIVATESGEMEIRRDGDLEARKAR